MPLQTYKCTLRNQQGEPITSGKWRALSGKAAEHKAYNYFRQQGYSQTAHITVELQQKKGATNAKA